MNRFDILRDCDEQGQAIQGCKTPSKENIKRLDDMNKPLVKNIKVDKFKIHNVFSLRFYLDLDNKDFYLPIMRKRELEWVTDIPSCHVIVSNQVLPREDKIVLSESKFRELLCIDEPSPDTEIVQVYDMKRNGQPEKKKRDKSKVFQKREIRVIPREYEEKNKREWEEKKELYMNVPDFIWRMTPEQLQAYNEEQKEKFKNARPVYDEYCYKFIYE